MSDSGGAKAKLVVIDGYGLLFRAFFAPGPYLSTADGRPTGAVFGFTNSLLSVLEQENPDAIYVAWDTGQATFRHESYAEYKAHRPEAGDDLKQQIPVARALVDAFAVATAEAPRFEADDLIGTLASRGVREGYAVIILTGDTDQLQLVGDGVTVKMVRRGVTEMKEYDHDAVIERYGIPPERVPDFKALVGDTSDNIPGVPGVGEKTATKLLQEFGTLENLLANVDKLPPGKVRDNLAAGGDQALKSRDLATIHCEVPFEGPIRRYEPSEADWERVRAMFHDLEFRSLLRRLPESGAPGRRAHEPVDGLAVALNAPYSGESALGSFEAFVIDGESALIDALAECARSQRVALRLVADSPSPMRAALSGIAFACGPERGWFVRVSPAQPRQPGLFDAEDSAPAGYSTPLESFRGILRRGGRAAHNAKYDLIVLGRHGHEPAPCAFDTLIAAYLLAPGRSAYPIDALAEELLGIAPDAMPADPGRRAAWEAAALTALRDPLAERLKSHGLEWIMDQVEMPLVPALAEMERTGVPVDQSWLARLAGELGAQVEALTERIHRLAGEAFNIGSPKQLGVVLFEKMKLPGAKKTATGYATGAEILEKLAGEHPIAASILEYRELAKLKSTYADALPKLVNPETGRIHTSLNQTVASTGRLSSSEPNLQNIPIRSEVGREIRKAFIAPAGQILLSCDYSQIELRIFAHVTRDAELMRAFAADEDIHAATATRLFGVEQGEVTPDMRRRAKTVNFAVIYGQSDFGLASQLGISNTEAKAFIDHYFALFPGVRGWADETLRGARSKGFVQTLLGRRRYLPDIRSGNFNIRQAAERAAVNMPIQGTAADIMKLAMIEVHRRLRESRCACTLLLQVHDELVFGIDQSILTEVAAEIVSLMENAYRLDVRLRVDAKAGPNWAEMNRVAL